MEVDTDDDWEIVPNPEEVGKLLDNILDEEGDLVKTSDLNRQHLPSVEIVNDEDTAEQCESEDIPKSPKSPLKRYNSPIFENLLPTPIEPVKLSTQLSIPADNSINNLIETASLVLKTTNTRNPMSDDAELTKTNTEIETENDNVIEVTNNNEDEDENKIDNEWLSLGNLGAEKRPSVPDPELVLMQNVVPGEKMRKH